MKTLATWLLAGGAAYLLLLALVSLYQPRLVFLPGIGGRTLTATPADLGLPYEELWLTAADGVRVHGWYVPGEGARRSLLFFHGNAGNISHRLSSLALFHELGMNVLMVDYRGYGQSGGRPSEAGLALDARAAWDHLVRERGSAAGDIVVFGRSLGGAVAARLATEVDPGALVVESSFTSVPDIGQELYPWLPVRWLSRLRFDTLDAVARVTCPVLVIHSPADEIIPFDHGRRLFEAAGGPKQFLEIGGGHNGGYLLDREGYLAGWRGFLGSLE